MPSAPIATPGTPAPRIVCITRNRGMRGTERMTDIYLQTLLRSGYNASLMLPHDAYLTKKLQQQGHGHRLFLLPTGWRFWLVLNPFFRRRVKHYLHGADLVLTHNVLLEDALRPLTDCPIVAVNHLSKIKRMARCDAVISLNNAISQKLLRPGGGFDATPERVILLHNRLEQIPQLTERATKKKAGRPTIGFLGAIVDGKGCGDLLAAVNLIQSPKLHLLYAGEGAFRKKLEKKAAQSQHRVEFLGHIHDLPGFFHRCDILCLPSHFDVFPLALVESMAFAMPVIATSHDGAVDLLEDGVNALLVPPRRPDKLAECIERLIGDAALCQTLARNARETVEKQLSPQAFGEQLSAALMQVIARHKAH